MTHAKRLWSIWQALLSAFAWAFTQPSFRRFVAVDPENRLVSSFPKKLHYK